MKNRTKNNTKKLKLTTLGFTLIELLGVIVILAIVLLLAFPPILEHIKRSKNELSESMEKVIISAADVYVDENKNSFPKTDGNIYCITLQDLVDNNHLREPLIDADNKEIELTNKIEVKVENNQYKYKMNNSCIANN